MTDTNKKIAEKIAKCLALAQSANAHEAEVALRQTEALMQKYNLPASDVAASKVNESEYKTSAQSAPAPYISVLAQVIADVFSCKVIAAKYVADKTAMRFMGVGVKAELAGYTFEVLQRHIKRDRRIDLATLSQCGRATKTRRGDLFCSAWVDNIRGHVSAFANQSEQSAIEAYLQKYYPHLTTYTVKQKAFKLSDYSAWSAGQLAAQNVSLHQPVQTQSSLLLSNELADELKRRHRS